MKNPNAWVLGINLLVYGLCYVLRPYFYFEYFFVFCGINVLMGILLLLLQKKALGQALSFSLVCHSAYWFRYLCNHSFSTANWQITLTT